MWIIYLVCCWACVYNPNVFVSSVSVNADSASDRKADSNEEPMTTGLNYAQHANLDGLNVDQPKSCAEARQSVINLVSKNAKRLRIPTKDGFITLGYTEKQGTWTLVNRGGRGVQLLLERADWKISGSIFKKNVYSLDSIYFNVGENSRIGAEHHIDGKTFPMEMALIHRIDHKATSSSGIDHEHKATESPIYAIITILFEENGSHVNINYDSLIEGLHGLTHGGENKTVASYILRQMLPKDAHKFFTYNGPMTIQPCVPDVLWIVFEKTIKISTGQMSVFQSMYNSTLEHIERYRRTSDIEDNVIERLAPHKQEIYFVEHVASDAVRETNSWSFSLLLIILCAVIA